MQISKPVWYANPKEVVLSVDPDKVKISPLGNEVVIVIEIDGDLRRATVPAKAFDQKRRTVVAAEVGEMGSSVLVSFPPGSSGTTTWAIPKSLIESLLV
ncbi:MAG: hypothetical protein V3V35_07580 [Dehalococcoidia bacterium]